MELIQATPVDEQRWKGPDCGHNNIARDYGNNKTIWRCCLICRKSFHIKLMEDC